ncbi:rhomboid family intramembrane serine protease [Nakamurella endophytica]|uniref:rhomboid family intramembrane serine protease n=1 Tax=Nakamurella endophytica TaxID=1748367 RepID=UPI001E49ED33|nr:rhomboid family intramembrane serine protease [Nakamurella endophytica]
MGFHCRACVAESRGQQRVARTVAGSRLGQQPVVTAALIAVNVVVFVVTAVQAGSVSDPSGSSVFRQGATIPELVSAGQYWRLLTGGFLHFGLPHIALNMISLYLLGMPLERILGRGRFLVVYLVALLGGSVSVLLFSGSSLGPTVGASGAIFGVMGAMVVTFRRLRLDPRQLFGLLAVNLVISFALPGISWQAHIGGLLTGAAAGAVMVYPPARNRTAWQVGGSVALVVLLGVVTAVWAGGHPAQFCSLQGDYFLPC